MEIETLRGEQVDKTALEKDLQEALKQMEQAMFTSDRYAAYTNWHRQHAIAGYIKGKLETLKEAEGGETKEEKTG